MKRGLKIVMVLSLSFIISAALIQCGGGHAPQSNGDSLNGGGAAANSTVTLKSITVTPANPSIILATGTTQTQQFTATGTYSDNSSKNLTALVTWSSSATSIATITSGGNATVLAFGSTTISATFGTITGSTALTVVSTASLKSIQVTPAIPTISLGAAKQFIATGTNFDGSTQNLTASVTWSSSTLAVATISNTQGSNGKATSVAAGETTITATLGSLTGSTILTITSPIINPLSYTTPVVAVLPASIAIDAPGNIWVTNFGVNSVIMLPTALTSSGGVVPSPIPSPTTYAFNGASPFGIAIDYVGGIWTANYDSGTVAMINLNRPAYNVNTCPQVGVGSPGGVFIATYSSGGTGPHGIAIDSSGNVWVTNFGSASVPGNTVTEFVTTYIFCQASATNPASVSVTPFTYPVGNNPYGIAIDSQGNAWVSNYGSNNVTELSSAGVLLNTYPVGNGPRGIAVDPFGNVWVANSGSDSAPGNTVTMINPATGGAANYPVGSGPHSIAIETSGNVWVTNFGTTTAPGNTITELNSNGAFLNTYTVGKNPEGISIDFWGNVWVTNYYDNTLTVWKGATQGPHFNPYEGPIWPE